MKLFFTLIFVVCTCLSSQAKAGAYEVGEQFYTIRNYSNALYLLEQAAADNDKRAYHLLAVIYDLRQEYENAIKYYVKDAESFKPGMPNKTIQEATFRALGVIFESRLPNYPEALKWYGKIPKEDMIAQDKFNVASMYLKGDAKLDRNMALGASLMQEAADEGYLGAVFGLGVCYEKGLGVSKNDAMAKKWFLKATVMTPNEFGDETYIQEAQKKLLVRG